MDLRLTSNAASRPLPRKPSGRLGILLLGFVVAGVTARFGDAPPAPPRPKAKSPAAAPLPIFRQSLSGYNFPKAF
jgi:hypothetical protein